MQGNISASGFASKGANPIASGGCQTSASMRLSPVNQLDGPRQIRRAANSESSKMRIFHPPRKNLLAILMLILFSGCTATGLTARDPEVRRQAILNMRNEVLTELYAIRPDTEAQIFSAVGFAVFSNASVSLVLNVGGGVGIVRNNSTGEDTYLRMGEVGIGLGAGVTDVRLVIVFHSEDALTRFTDAGFTVGGDADVAARAGELGAAIGAEAIADNVTVYQITESGLALQASVQAARYWSDPDLN